VNAARRRARPPIRDEGFSIVEVVVTMSILSVVMVITTGAIMQIYNAMNRVETTSVARDQLTNSFRRLDKELRYASWLSLPPYQVGSAWYFEYKTPDGCRQLAFRSGVLTIAGWSGLSGTTPGAATTIATGLSQVSGIDPFWVNRPGSHPYSAASAGTAGVGAGYSPEHGQVRLRFIGQTGQTTLPFDVIFTAQNNDGATNPNNPCSKGRP
jgi:prepilin-type N-terminal cleavage/methylation domain-containing protein